MSSAHRGATCAHSLFGVALAMACCAPHTTPPAHPTRDATPPRAGDGAAPSQAPTPAPAATRLPPLDADAALTALAVPGHGDAVLSLPLRATRPVPVIVAAHGHYDTPEAACEEWRAVVGDTAFVLCPRGNSLPGPDGVRYSFPGGAAFDHEIGAALRALRERYPGYVDPGAIGYAGFSRGAILGAPYARRAGAVWVVMTEGSAGEWSRAAIESFGRAGGRAVLFACGTAWCERAARAALVRFRGSGVRARLVASPGAGHAFAPSVSRCVAREFAWVVRDDARFAGARLPEYLDPDERRQSAARRAWDRATGAHHERPCVETDP